MAFFISPLPQTQKKFGKSLQLTEPPKKNRRKKSPLGKLPATISTLNRLDYKASTTFTMRSNTSSIVPKPFTETYLPCAE